MTDPCLMQPVRFGAQFGELAGLSGVGDTATGAGLWGFGVAEVAAAGAEFCAATGARGRAATTRGGGLGRKRFGYSTRSHSVCAARLAATSARNARSAARGFHCLDSARRMPASAC